jgi:hypothetical protein
MAKRYALALGAGIVLIAAIAAGAFRPDRAARVAAGVAAHNLCSATFVAGLDPGATFRELIGAFLQGPARRLLQYKVDRDARGVEASFAGLKLQLPFGIHISFRGLTTSALARC